MQQEKPDFDYIVTPLPEKVARIFHLPYPLAWVVISGALLGLHIGGCLYLGVPVESTGLVVVFAILPGCIATGIIWFSKALEKFTPSIFMFIDWPKDQILKWYERELRAIFNLKWMIVSGIGLTGLCFLSILTSDYWVGLERIPKITFGLMVGMIGFLGGGMLYAILRIGLMVHKMGGLEAIRVSIYQHPVTSVRAVGSLLSKVALAVIGIYLLGILVVFSETGIQGKLVFCLAGVFGVVVAGFFLFPQIKIHQIMSKVKHLRLREFSRHLEEALDGVTREPSRENVQRVRELFEIQRSLNGMGEWPFDTRAALLIVTGVAIPLIVLLLQIICTRK